MRVYPRRSMSRVFRAFSAEDFVRLRFHRPVCGSAKRGKSLIYRVVEFRWFVSRVFHIREHEVGALEMSGGGNRF